MNGKDICIQSCVLAAVTCLPSLAEASVQSGVKIDILTIPPGSVVNGAIESDTLIRAFDEKQGLPLPSDLGVDHLGPTSGPINGPSDPDRTPGVIPAGTVVSSHFLHFDPSTNDDGVTTSIQDALATFDAPILGLIFLQPNFDDSDDVVGLGLLGVTYPTGDNRSLEGNDIIEIVDGTISLDIANLATVGGGIDQIRVITAVVPEPRARLVWLILVATGSVLSSRSHRKLTHNQPQNRCRAGAP